MTVNGEAVDYRLAPETPLLWALRDASNLTGTKYGCDSADCGACTVLVDGRPVQSCTMSLSSLEGADITTIEGLAGQGTHPLQVAWAEQQVSQCGYCDPGFLMALAALIRANPRPSTEELAGLPNLCRCGAGPRILEALAKAGTTVAAQAVIPPPGSAARTADVQPPLR